MYEDAAGSQSKHMKVVRFHLAQANVAQARAPITDPIMKGFVSQLDHVNALADEAPGFVWRLQTEDGNATAIRAFGDPTIMINMSVWESIEQLHDFVYRPEHRGPMGDRRKWFLKMERPHTVLWWIPAGELPTVADAEARLDLLRDFGPTPDAFTFARRFGPTGEPIAPAKSLEEGCEA